MIIENFKDQSHLHPVTTSVLQFSNIILFKMGITEAAIVLPYTPTLTRALLILPVFYVVFTVIYRIYFHPLSKYDGPLLGKFTALPKMLAMFRMDRLTWQREMLLKYGNPVRISTNELIFGDMKSWQDIYGQSSNPCMKEPGFYDMFTATGATSILNEINRTRHSRLRRLVSHGFSLKGLLQDEPLMQEKIETLINTVIRPAAERRQPVDVFHKMMEHVRGLFLS